MNAVRKALCWCLLYAGVVSLLIVVFGLTMLAATFLGLYSALAVFIRLVGTITASITLLFAGDEPAETIDRSAEHTSELQSLMRPSYAVFRLRKKMKRTFICLAFTRNTSLSFIIDKLTHHTANL